MPVSVNAKYAGICSTCSHAPACTYPRGPERPVINCEEFDGEVGETSALEPAVKDALPSSATRAQRSLNSDSDEDDHARYRGLCSNCDERKSCKYPKPDGGVWHCEEYR